MILREDVKELIKDNCYPEHNKIGAVDNKKTVFFKIITFRNCGTEFITEPFNFRLKI
jgi:hypothetical protein